MSVLTADSCAADFETYVDGLEAITVRTKGGRQRSVSKALRRAISYTDANASGGKVVAGDVRWHFTRRMHVDRPDLGSRIEAADGSQWTILSVRLETLGSRWACDTRDLAVSHGLNSRVTIQEATFLKGKAGAAFADWNDFKVGVRARVHPVESATERGDGHVGNEGRFEITLAENWNLEPHRHRIKDAVGRIHRIESYADAEEITALPKAQTRVSVSTEGARA